LHVLVRIYIQFFPTDPVWVRSLFLRSFFRA
jgi:hypothetical protein